MARTAEIRIADLAPTKACFRALTRLLREVEDGDPALLPDSLVAAAADARAVLDEWRLPGRHQRRPPR